MKPRTKILFGALAAITLAGCSLPEGLHSGTPGEEWGSENPIFGESSDAPAFTQDESQESFQGEEIDVATGKGALLNAFTRSINQPNISLEGGLSAKGSLDADLGFAGAAPSGSQAATSVDEDNHGFVDGAYRLKAAVQGLDDFSSFAVSGAISGSHDLTFEDGDRMIYESHLSTDSSMYMDNLNAYFNFDEPFAAFMEETTAYPYGPGKVKMPLGTGRDGPVLYPDNIRQIYNGFQTGLEYVLKYLPTQVRFAAKGDDYRASVDLTPVDVTGVLRMIATETGNSSFSLLAKGMEDLDIDDLHLYLDFSPKVGVTGVDLALDATLKTTQAAIGLTGSESPDAADPFYVDADVYLDLDFAYGEPVAVPSDLDQYENRTVYYVGFNANGGYCDTSYLNIVSGAYLDLPTPYHPDGYAFLGWYEGGTKIESGPYDYDRNLYLTARWDIPDDAFFPGLDLDQILSRIDLGEDLAFEIWCPPGLVDSLRTLLDDRIASLYNHGYQGEIQYYLREVEEYIVPSEIASSASTPAIYFFHQDGLRRLYDTGFLDQVPGSIAQQVNNSIDSSAYRSALVDGRLYAYPATNDNGYFLYYNKAYLSESDVRNWETIVSVAEAKRQYVNFNYSSAWYNYGFFAGAGCDSRWRMDGRGAFIAYEDNYNSDNGLIAARALSNVIASDYCKDNSSAYSMPENSLALVSGTWDYNSVLSYWGDNLGCAELPYFTVDGQSYHTSSFAAPRHVGVSPHGSYAYRTIAHLLAYEITGAAAQAERLEMVGWVPSNNAAASVISQEERPDLYALWSQNEFSMPQGTYPGQWWDNAGRLAMEIQSAGKDPRDEALRGMLENYAANLDSMLY